MGYTLESVKKYFQIFLSFFSDHAAPGTGAINAIRNYSSSETVIGKWIDNKPIYRQIFTYTGLSSTTIAIGTITGGVDAIIDVYGYGVWSDVSQVRPLRGKYSKDVGFLVGSSGSVEVEFQSTSGWASHCDYWVVIIEYTKP